MFGQISLVKPSSTGILFVGIFFFLITDSILMLIIGLHKLSLSDLVLEESMFLGIY